MNFTANDVEVMIENQRAFYFTGATKDVEFRKEQLLKLKDTIKKYEEQVIEALALDLRKSEFEAFTTEIGIVYDSISYFLKNINNLDGTAACQNTASFPACKKLCCA